MKLDLTGRRFGRLIALKDSDERYQGSIKWLCRCDCGNLTKVTSSSLVSGHTKSCGCLGKERRKEANTIHGMSRTPTYKTWVKIKQRCLNPNNSRFKDYGGRGIKVCDHWMKFENFYKNMGDKPEGKSIDRINNDGDYEPKNCKWSTAKQQAENRRPKSSGPAEQKWFRAWKENVPYQLFSNNQTAFARKWGLCRRSIGRCLAGQFKQTKGWSFALLKNG